MRRGPADAVRRSKRPGQFETEGFSRVHVMDYGGYPYEEPYARPRRRVNYFAWTVAILLLSGFALAAWLGSRSEEHTSELQSHHDLVCRLLLEKKKQYITISHAT